MSQGVSRPRSASTTSATGSCSSAANRSQSTGSDQNAGVGSLSTSASSTIRPSSPGWPGSAATTGPTGTDQDSDVLPASTRTVTVAAPGPSLETSTRGVSERSTSSTPGGRKVCRSSAGSSVSAECACTTAPAAQA